MNTISHEEKEYDLCIVGCGIAGLACAAQALEYNPNLTICMLEASNRIGGRILKVDFPVVNSNHPNQVHTIPIDVGAMYMHGLDLEEDPENPEESDDPFFEHLVRELGIPFGFVYDETDEEVGGEYIFDPSTREVVELETFEYTQLVEDAMNKYKELFHECPNEAPPVTLSNWLRSYNEEEGLHLTAEQMHNVLRLADRIVAKDVCADGDTLLLNHYSSKSEAWGYGAKSVYLQGQMTQVLDHFVGLVDQPNVSIFLNSPVEQIGLTEDEEKTVVTTNDDREFVAAQTVCSVPLSIIQQRILQFYPSLPKKVMKTIDSIQMHAACKIVIQMDRQICDRNLVLTKHSDLFGELLFEERQVDENFSAHIAMALCAGYLGENCEKKSDEELIALFSEELVFMFKTEFECLGGHVTRWSRMEYCRGGYSSSPDDPSVRLVDVERLRKPFWDECLFFCGEGVAESESCVQEAIISGREAAEWAVGPEDEVEES